MPDRSKLTGQPDSSEAVIPHSAAYARVDREMFGGERSCSLTNDERYVLRAGFSQSPTAYEEAEEKDKKIQWRHECVDRWFEENGFVDPMRRQFGLPPPPIPLARFEVAMAAAFGSERDESSKRKSSREEVLQERREHEVEQIALENADTLDATSAPSHEQSDVALDADRGDQKNEASPKLLGRMRLPVRPLNRKNGHRIASTAAWDTIGLHEKWPIEGFPLDWSDADISKNVNDYFLLMQRKGKIKSEDYDFIRRDKANGLGTLSLETICRHALMSKRSKTQ